MPHSNSADGSILLRSFHRWRIVEGKILRWVAYLCGLLFLVYSFYVALEVVGRRYFGVYTGVADEIGAYVLAIGGTLAFAYTLLAGGHVRIDIVFGFLSERARPWFDFISMVAMALFAWIVAYYIFNLTLDSLSRGATGHSLIQMPQWMIQGFVLLGYGLLGLFSLTSSISHLLKALMPDRWRDPLGVAAEHAEDQH